GERVHHRGAVRGLDRGDRGDVFATEGRLELAEPHREGRVRPAEISVAKAGSTDSRPTRRCAQLDQHLVGESRWQRSFDADAGAVQRCRQATVFLPGLAKLDISDHTRCWHRALWDWSWRRSGGRALSDDRRSHGKADGQPPTPLPKRLYVSQYALESDFGAAL